MSNYYVTISFYSEPNFQGNCSLYYLQCIRGKKIIYGGTAYKKLYVQKNAVLKAAKKTKEIFPTAKVEVHEIYPMNGAFNTRVIE